MKFSKWLFILILLLGWYSSAQAEVGVFPDKIVLGSSEALSGHIGFLGQSLSLGLKSYFNYINDQGGINGKKIELLILDDKYEPNLTIMNTSKLISQSFALIGYIGTPTTVAVLSEIEKNKIPLLGPFTGAHQLRFPFRRYIFNIRNSYWAETAALVEYAIDILKKDKIAVFYQNDAYGQTGCQGVENHLMKKYEKEVTCKAVYQRGARDVSLQAKKICACRPDVVIMIGTYGPCASFIKTAKKLGCKAIFMNISVVGSYKLKEILKSDAEGVIISQVVPPPTDTKFAAVREYQKLMKRYFPGKPLTFVGLEGFIDAKVMVEALKRIKGEITREALVKALEGLRNLDIGIGATISYSEVDHEGLDVVYITQIKNGNFHLLQQKKITPLLPTQVTF